MKLRPWISAVSSHKESYANINLIIAFADLGIIIGAGTTRGFGSDLEETTSLSREINKVMDLQASLKDMYKKRRTDVGPMNVVISSKEETDSGRLKYYRKRKVDHTRPSSMITATLISPSISSPSIAHTSFLIAAHGISPLSTPHCILSFLPLVEETLSGEDGELFPRCGRMSM